MKELLIEEIAFTGRLIERVCYMNSSISYKKIKKEEFDKLKRLFPSNEELWIRYRKEKFLQFDEHVIDVYVIEYQNAFIGEITVSYMSHSLQSETIPNKRVYLEAFRVEKAFQGKGLGQQLISYTIADLKERGFTEFTIGVEEENEAAKHIYFKLGFTEAIDKGHGNQYDSGDYTLYLYQSDTTDCIACSLSSPCKTIGERKGVRCRD